MSQDAMPAHAQQQLLRALLGDRDDSALSGCLQGGAGRAALNRRGLQVYQANGAALAERALAAAYPVMAQLIGEDSFAPLARHIWRQQPPRRGDIAAWGEALADFLAASPQLAADPYLADVARVEWALHLAGTAADVATDLASLALLITGEPDCLRLQLATGVACVASPWPVVSLVLAHQQPDGDLADAAQKLQQGVAETALVWRQGLKPRLCSISAAEHALVLSLQSGASLARAIEGVPALDFQSWLASAVAGGLVVGARAGIPGTSLETGTHHEHL